MEIIFCITSSLWGDSTGDPHECQWSETLMLRLDERLGKQSSRRWFKTPSRSLMYNFMWYNRYCCPGSIWGVGQHQGSLTPRWLNSVWSTVANGECNPVFINRAIILYPAVLFKPVVLLIWRSKTGGPYLCNMKSSKIYYRNEKSISMFCWWFLLETIVHIAFPYLSS